MPLARIPPGSEAQAPLTSGGLVRLARVLSERLRLDCVSCRQRLKMTISGGHMRLGTSANMLGVDPNQPGLPRLVFWCPFCKKMLGFVQGDEWLFEDGVLGTPGTSRWDHLEMDDEA